MSVHVEWQWSPGFRRDSSLEMYYVTRIGTVALVGVWAVWLGFSILTHWREGSLVRGLLQTGPVALSLAGLTFGPLHLAYKYVAYIRITPEGLLVRKGKVTRLQPWQTIGDIWPVRFAA